jgi:hypothetical protein
MRLPPLMSRVVSSSSPPCGPFRVRLEAWPFGRRSPRRGQLIDPTLDYPAAHPKKRGHGERSGALRLDRQGGHRDRGRHGDRGSDRDVAGRNGADVAIAARTVADLEATSARVESATSRRCLAVPTDGKVEAAVTNLMSMTVAEFGRIDILINNAGGTRMSPLADIPMCAWDSSFELHVRSAYVATREAGPTWPPRKAVPS